MTSDRTRVGRDQLLSCPRCAWIMFLTGDDEPLEQRIQQLVGAHLQRSHPGEVVALEAFLQPQRPARIDGDDFL